MKSKKGRREAALPWVIGKFWSLPNAAMQAGG
jgi:hypothetical protein